MSYYTTVTKVLFRNPVARKNETKQVNIWTDVNGPDFRPFDSKWTPGKGF